MEYEDEQSRSRHHVQHEYRDEIYAEIRPIMTIRNIQKIVGKLFSSSIVRRYELLRTRERAKPITGSNKKMLILSNRKDLFHEGLQQTGKRPMLCYLPLHLLS